MNAAVKPLLKSSPSPEATLVWNSGLMPGAGYIQVFIPLLSWEEKKCDTFTHTPKHPFKCLDEFNYPHITSFPLKFMKVARLKWELCQPTALRDINLFIFKPFQYNLLNIPVKVSKILLLSWDIAIKNSRYVMMSQRGNLKIKVFSFLRHFMVNTQSNTKAISIFGARVFSWVSK